MGKKLIYLTALCLLLFNQPSWAQPSTRYQDSWKKVEQFEKKGLTASANKEAHQIFLKAMQDKQPAEEIRALLFMMKYRQTLEEDPLFLNFNMTDSLVSTSSAPVKNILLSLQAAICQHYIAQNRYQLYERTKLDKEEGNDIRTWSIDKLIAKTTELYQASLQDANLLQQSKLSDWEPMLEKGENTRHLRPTVYDLLAHRALDFFMNDEYGITKPAEQFILQDARAFAEAPEFINTRFSTADSSSGAYIALTILQQIMAFHLHDAIPDALLDADLIRLSFVNRKAVFSNKNKLYEASLQSIENRLMGNPLSAEAMFLRASLYATKGRAYQAETNPDARYELNRAVELCEKTIQSFPASDAAILASKLLTDLKRPFLNIETELVNLPGQAFRSLITYRNLSGIYLRISRISREELKEVNKKPHVKLWEDIISRPAAKTWTVNLPDPKDLQEHSTEIKVEALPAGTYILVASKAADFGLEENIMSRQVVYVSRISHIQNNKNGMYVLDRETGEPLAGATITMWENMYNYQSGTTETKTAGQYKANDDGFISLKQEESYRSRLVQIRWKDDELFTDEQYYSGYYDSEEDTDDQRSIFFFTDRSIYRPGQKVYFKGIVIDKNSHNRSNKIVPHAASHIQLLDANGQKAASLDLISNEYGSFNGSFILPQNLLPGQFFIKDTLTESSQHFQVEEYKRPKFSVDIPAVAGTYRVNDSIKVTGTARAYAGYSIDGASVSYRVTRNISYPAWWMYGRSYKGGPWFPGGRTEKGIANGQVKTGPDGSFSIPFIAVPDEEADKKWQPVFHYEITADVTDLNGETRTGKSTLAVSYQAIQLEIETVPGLHPDSITTMRIRSRNMNGLFSKTQATLQAVPLLSPGRFIRERYWEKPDQYTMGKDAFLQSFPHDPYEGEDKVSNWPSGNRSWEITDSTSENGQFAIPSTRLPDGWYRMIATAKDSYGEEARAEQLVRISAGNILPTEAVRFITSNKKALPGETIRISYQTSFNQAHIIQTINKPGRKAETITGQARLLKPMKQDLAINEQDRGGINLNYTFVRYNRLFQGNQALDIPWDNKMMTISVETFRDKTLPGSNETWSLKINGKDADKQAAEMLISMYDASLDQFLPHSWNSLSSIWPGNHQNLYWNSPVFKQTGSQSYFSFRENVKYPKIKRYDAIITNRYWPSGGKNRLDEVVVSAMGSTRQANELGFSSTITLKGKRSDNDSEDSKYEHDQISPADKAEKPSGDMKVRTNFNETAFFFPDLRTDSSGSIRFSFTMPEALTTWKLMALAHTKNLVSGYTEKTTITQKPLMVQPNAPRFVRQGDKINWPVKLVNLSDHEINGTVQLELMDAATNKPVDGWFKNIFPLQHMSLEPGKSMALQFPLEIPASFGSALTWRVVAISNDRQFSDGEEASLPVLSNRMLVTESMPIGLRNKNTASFSFQKLIDNQSPTLVSQSLTVEYSSNPAWYAVQSLPYLMEFPHECAEQQFNRFFANTLAATISNRHPLIRNVFEQWKNRDTAALLSNLSKNQELKSALLQETPWVLDAQDEKKQKEQIALLFDLDRLSMEKKKTWQQISEMQTAEGGFSWFRQGPDNRYITQYIVSGIGHLFKLGALGKNDESLVNPLLHKALAYLDARIADDYRQLKRSKANLKRNQLTITAIHYLYMRSFFPDKKIPAAAETAYQYYRKQAKQFWLTTEKNAQAMIALALSRTGENKVPKAIIRSLKENAINNEELGMYWKDLARPGYYWNQSPLENQAMMIEAFTEIDKDPVTIDNLKTWLLRNKQTRHWGTTKATAEACYALLLGGSDWISEQKKVTISLGEKAFSSTDETAEAGTGYIKKSFKGEEISPEMGRISVNIEGKESTQSSWGAVYWQYFEDLDKITPSASPLKLEKKLYLQQSSPAGPVLKELKEGDEWHIGDKAIVRIILRSDRDMEFLHLKDMRGACMEPVNVISGYKWQNGLGYYESTKDAATHFFFDRVPRGTYVFEYPIFVAQSGRYSNGISSIQCMYAPEFSSHSEGLTIEVGE